VPLPHQALDRVLVEAGRHGVRLILSLANNLEAYGGKTQYVRWAWEEGVGTSASNDSFFYDPAIRDYFKVYLKVSSASAGSFLVIIPLISPARGISLL
jgi:endo-1,4-beta-mannosidase